MIRFYLLVSAAMLFAGCKKNDTVQPPSGNVMVVNACANVGATYITDGTKIIGQAGNLFNGDSLNSIPYQPLATSTPGISFFEYSLHSSAPIQDFPVSFSDGAHYSVFLGGILNITNHLVTTDDLTAPAAGKANVRFVNVCHDSFSRTLTVGPNVIGSALLSPQVTSFISIDSGRLTLKALHLDDTTTIIKRDSVLFSEGKIYTIVLMDSFLLNGTSFPRLSIINNK